MQKTFESHNVQYYAPEIEEIITMIPVMDALAAKYRGQVEEIDRRKKDNSGKIEQAILKAAKTLDQLEVLMDLGFRTSNNNKDVQMADEIVAFTIREQREE